MCNLYTEKKSDLCEVFHKLRAIKMVFPQELLSLFQASLSQYLFVCFSFLKNRLKCLALRSAIIETNCTQSPTCDSSG